VKDIIIAIDGYSSCGKSTLAKDLAKILDYLYIDSGAMYRAVTLTCLNANLIENDKINIDRLKELLQNTTIAFKQNNQTGRFETFLNDELVEDRIRDINVSNNVSLVSTIDFVREKMVHLQQEIGKNKRIVMDGRDIGTVVFPTAELKLFMIADSEIRAERRYKELSEKNKNITLQEIAENIKKRDFIDQNREISPLKQAEDAIVLNNNDFTQQEQLNIILNIIKEKFQ